MKVLTTAREMLDFAKEAEKNGLTIGFVPTMGALHRGHLSLVEAAKQNTDVVVVSVFVNPTQFNSSSDLAKYPRTFDSDRKLLENNGVHVMFFPSVDEIYPDSASQSPTFDLDGLDQNMEGPNRPGHFNGVVQVVMRLFDLVGADMAFFGEKDFQQLAIIRHMVKKLDYAVNIVGCPTVREPSGLAMSSRNVRLSEQGRVLSTELFETLIQLRNELKTLSPDLALKNAKARIHGTPHIKLEYLELVDPETLLPIGFG
ncbi:MAG: hypothetical protein RL266_2724, partial [Bacteroidota bacterium]